MAWAAGAETAGRGGAGAPDTATPATGALPAGAVGCKSANQLLLMQTPHALAGKWEGPARRCLRQW